MEEISFKGENYVKASVLARKYGYTADYVGQLCRADQVKATLVGRSWYVNEESLLAHRKGRYRSTLAKSKEMVRKLAEERVQTHRPVNVKRIVRYEADERDLLPHLGEKESFEDDDNTLGSKEELVVETEVTGGQGEQMSSQESDFVPAPRPVPITRYRRPPVRTIPAYVVSEITPRVHHRPTEQRQARAVPVRKNSWAIALLTIFLVGEIVFMTAALGLEKRLTATAEGNAAVAYDFKPSMVAASIMSLLEP